MTGLDIHGGLRIRFDFENGVPLASAEPGVHVAADVDEWIVAQQERVDFAKRWLKAWKNA